MELKTIFTMIFLVIGLLGVPNCIFAQQCQDSPSDTILQSNLPALVDSNGLIPQLRRGGRGGGGLRSTGEFADELVDEGLWWIVILIIIIIIAVWYFFLRK
ncbi:MAG: hypothetical protein PQ964_00615 [Methanobacteriaceae archaeon]|jgi:hypothetical protein